MKISELKNEMTKFPSKKDGEILVFLRNEKYSYKYPLKVDLAYTSSGDLVLECNLEEQE